jgi:tRNA nucleotidyltransferase/poly(A) polymerase
MGYDIRKRIIEDPLNGIRDLEMGIARPPLPGVPLGKDFFRIFSVLKTSAKAGLKLNKEFKYFIRDSKDFIKEYLLYYRVARTCHKFRKITDDSVHEFSIRAFKLLIEYNIIDSFVSIDNIAEFAYNQTDYKNNIFNLALLSEFVMKYVDHPKFVMDHKQKHYVYNEVFNLAFQQKDEIRFFYDTFNATKFEVKMENLKTILKTAKKYCDIIECKKDIIKFVNLNLLKQIIYEFI